MEKITYRTNFCRIFELPEEYPNEYCFNGGHFVPFLMVDWFSPIPFTEFPEYGGNGPEPWEVYEPMLLIFLKKKQYVKPGREYLVITNFGESFVFKGE